MTSPWLRVTIPAGLLLAAQSAVAVSLSTSGLGQALIYPYYTVNKNQDTLISIVNASDTGKIIEISALEGYNGRNVLRFLLFLSAHDVWTAAISQTADDGGAILRTSDTSCTLPQVPVAGIAFASAGYDGTGPVPADAGPDGIARTREGLLTVFAQADIAPGSTTEAAITHVQNGSPGGGVPASCDTLNIPSYMSDAITPTNSLFGSGAIVNVGQGTFFAYNATALAGYTAIPLLSPDASLHPPFADANSAEAVHGVATSYTTDAEGQPFAADWAFGQDAVTAVLMVDTIQNEYLTSPSLGASTDWIVTFPTKQLYVDELYGIVPFLPFEEAFHAPGVSGVTFTAAVLDREEAFLRQPPECLTSPCVGIPPPSLDYEVNVLGFSGVPGVFENPGTPSPVLGSTLTPDALVPLGDNGIAIFDLWSQDGGHGLFGGIDADGTPVAMYGLPAIGFMVYNIVNAQAQPGLLANYGGTFTQRATTCSLASAAAPLAGPCHALPTQLGPPPQ